MSYASLDVIRRVAESVKSLAGGIPSDAAPKIGIICGSGSQSHDPTHSPSPSFHWPELG